MGVSQLSKLSYIIQRARTPIYLFIWWIMQRDTWTLDVNALFVRQTHFTDKQYFIMLLKSQMRSLGFCVFTDKRRAEVKIIFCWKFPLTTHISNMVWTPVWMGGLVSRQVPVCPLVAPDGCACGHPGVSFVNSLVIYSALNSLFFITLSHWMDFILQHDF